MKGVLKVKTVNRGWLKKQIEKGIVMARCDYHYTDDYAWDYANNCGKQETYIPCRMKGDHEKNTQGFICFSDWDLRTKTGGAYWENEAEKIIGLSIHSNLAYTLKITA